jgi:hypothetical protein
MIELNSGVCFSACCMVMLMGCGDAAARADVDADTEMWPRRVTLTTLEVGMGETIRLSDGVITDDGDLRVQQAMVISLGSAAAESFCEKGTSFTSLDAIPTDVASCTDWQGVAYLSGASIHESDESNSIGLGLLVWDAQHESLYRLRVLGDSYEVPFVATATFEYEPVP